MTEMRFEGWCVTMPDQLVDTAARSLAEANGLSWGLVCGEGRAHGYRRDAQAVLDAVSDRLVEQERQRIAAALDEWANERARCDNQTTANIAYRLADAIRQDKLGTEWP